METLLSDLAKKLHMGTIIKLFVKRGSREGDETYYLHVPRDVARLFNITPKDLFQLDIQVDNNGEIKLIYKRIKR